jgi:hypothetical protein
MAERNKNKICVIIFILFTVVNAWPADTINIKKVFSVKCAGMVFKERNELFEVNGSWSGTVTFDIIFKSKKKQYILSSGLQSLYINTSMPDYFKLEHGQFMGIVNLYSQNELKDKLGIKTMNLSYYGVPLSFSYVYEFNKINIGVGTGVVFYTSFDRINEFDMISSPHVSDKFVGLILKRNWIRSYTEFKIQYPLTKKVYLENGLEMNLSALLFPLDKHEIINDQYIPPGIPSKGPPGSNQYVSPYKMHTYNLKISFDRIKFFNAYLKLVL